MIELIFKVLDTGLSLWLSMEKSKYVDKLMSLKKDYYLELNKPINDRSDAVLDNIEFELRILGLAFSSSAASQNTSTQP